MGTTTFEQAVADKICERIALGESLRGICTDEGMPSASTVFKWLSETPAFSEQYAQARVWQAETLMDQVLELADDMSQDGQPGAFGVVGNAAAVSRSKLQVDARLKLMQQLAPKKYGPKMAVTGADGGPLVPPPDLSNLSADDLRTMLDLRRKMRPQEGQTDAS